MELLTKLLYWLSTGLFIPLMIALLIYLFRSLLLIGGFYSLFVNRKKFGKTFQSFLVDLENKGKLLDTQNLTVKSTFGVHLKKLIKHKDSFTKIEKVLADFELACQKDLGKAKTLAKMGPMLGLMGTLIPMGPALVGLAKGDIASLAENMQVAFATTVIGLLVGGIGFLLGQVKQAWYAEDVNNLQYTFELIKEQQDVKNEI